MCCSRIEHINNSVIPVSADTGMTRYEAERQYTGGWADVVQNSIASGGYVVEA